MLESNRVTPSDPSELKFMQKIKKSRLIRNISEENYRKAPDYLRYDIDVVESLIIVDPNAINSINISIALNAIERNPSLFGTLSERDQEEIILENPEYISRLPEDRAIRHVDKHGMMYIKYLSPDLQEKLLLEEVPVEGRLTSFTPEKSLAMAEYFSPSVIKKYVSSIVREGTMPRPKLEDKLLYEDMLYRISIERMPTDVQKSLVEIEPRLVNKAIAVVFKEVLEEKPEIIKYVTDSIGRVQGLSPELQTRLATMDGRVLTVMSKDAKEYAKQKGMMSQIEQASAECPAKETANDNDTVEQDKEETTQVPRKGTEDIEI